MYYDQVGPSLAMLLTPIGGALWVHRCPKMAHLGRFRLAQFRLL